MQAKKYFIFISIFVMPSTLFAQVKIGDTTGVINPKAVLELKDTTKGFLLPRMSNANMLAISSPPDGLLVFNKTAKSIYQYKLDNNMWMPLRSDSSDWYLDTTSKKLYLKYGLANTDSIYYHTLKKKFLFTDTRFYTTSNGSVFNLDEGNSDKYIFKTTASKFPRDAVNLNSANLYSIFEVDNDTAAVNHPFESIYNGTSVNAVVTPSATQKIGALYGINNTASNAGADTLSILYGTYNGAFVRGKGYTESATGLFNSVGIRDSAISNVGTMYGINNTFSYSSTSATSRVDGNLYGYYLNIGSSLANKVDGSAYGLFLRNVTAATGSKNWSIYTFKGVSRLGDSVLITDGISSRPRAVLDVNSTSAMIIPSGSTAQRPTTLYTGMIRYNADNATPEAYTASGWVNMRSNVLSTTAPIDPPLIANTSMTNIAYTFTGAAVGNTVTISPASALPNGIFIAWARLAAANQIEFALGNYSGASVDLPLQNFYIKLIQ